MKNMYIYSFTLSIPSIPSHSYSSDSSSTWIAPSAPSEAHSREFIESCRERNKCAYPESLCVGCSGQKQTSQAPPAGWAQPFWLPAQLHPWAIQGGSTQCKVPEMGLEPGQCQGRGCGELEGDVTDTDVSRSSSAWMSPSLLRWES